MFHKFSAKIENLSYKISVNQYKIHKFFKEWRAGIFFILLVKFLTMGVSIFAGFYYFKSIIYPLLNNQFFTNLFSVLFLLALEILTAFFISKFFKFFLRKNFKTMVMPFVAAVGLFTISFLTSTNGLSMQQSNQANQTYVISDNYSVQTIAVTNNFESQIEEVKKQILTIENNPSEWRAGKRDVLSKFQLNKIDSLYNVIALLNTDLKSELTKIETAKSNELSTNTIVMTNEAAKYYKVVSIIMFIQLVCNFLLMFFWAKIYEENEQSNYTTELVQQIGTEINESVFSLMFGTMQKNLNMFLSAFGIEIDKIQPQPRVITNEKTHVTDDKKSVEIPKPTHQIGFIKTVENKNSTNENALRYNAKEKICLHCGKNFKYRTTWQKFCSTECRLQWHKENKGFDLSKHLKYTKKNK